METFDLYSFTLNLSGFTLNLSGFREILTLNLSGFTLNLSGFKRRNPRQYWAGGFRKGFKSFFLLKALQGKDSTSKSTPNPKVKNRPQAWQASSNAGSSTAGQLPNSYLVATR